MNAMSLYAAPLGRVLISLIFLVAGWAKMTAYAGTLTYMESHNIPGILLPAVILIELGGGILILIGWQTRITALLMAGFTLLTAIFFHQFWVDAAQQNAFMKNVAIAGGFLFLVAYGAGVLSVDNRRRSDDRVASTVEQETP